MAAGTNDGVGQAPACLCVLCGLPAAGKSFLAREVRCAAANYGWRAAVVAYDDLIPEHAFQYRVLEDGVERQEMHTEWKLHRQAVLQCIEQVIKKCDVLLAQPNSCHINSAAWTQCIQALLQPEALDCSQTDQAPLLFLLDDNFYYPSMRYEVYQLARKYSVGFCQVYLHCDLDSCISRNQGRSQPIPTEVILDMVKRLESPKPQKNLWETNSISINTTHRLSQCDMQKVIELILFSLSNPLRPIEDNTELKETDRLKCATSVLHQADQACRRLISEAMKTARESHLSPDRMRYLATHLNESKATFLHSLRKHFLQEFSTIGEEDMDVERVVKKAVDVFNLDKEQIMLKITNDFE